ncbi:MAG TPA: CCA tRNA nucleotidyltransferase [Stellaceae bacterium]|nr:CCA tRNA nucleotidyltransferase [Stellaceae bacterium]
MSLQPAWLSETPVRRLLAALTAAGIEARFVGGCVRDALLGDMTGDLDLATPAPPQAVMAALAAAKVKALPTGIAHGTVTATIPPRSFEITTLRRDVETDGRHAIVAFGADWVEDAARRDFTINAIYLSPDGTIFDPVGGQADLAARRVRFVGDPATRITEDVLRILRYYRFEARFGGSEGDAAARAECRAAAGRLLTLSAERVWRELGRLLSLPRPARAFSFMHEDGVLAAILPEATRLDRLEQLLPLAAADDSLLRLAALTEVDEAGAKALAKRLRLSAAETKRLAGLTTPWPLDPAGDVKAQRLALYRCGPERYGDAALLLAADGKLQPAALRKLLDLAEGWEIPVFPLGGDDVAALGIAPGPKVGRLLAAVKRWWEDGDFAADRAGCLARLKEIAGQP